MTLSDQMKSDVDSVFLNTSDFAETVTRYIDGDTSHTDTFPGIVTWAAMSEDYSHGRSTVRIGEIMVSDSVTVTVKDALKIDGYKTEVTKVGPIQDGAYFVSVKQVLPEQKGARPVYTGDI